MMLRIGGRGMPDGYRTIIAGSRSLTFEHVEAANGLMPMG